MIYTMEKLQQRIISMKYNIIYHSKTLAQSIEIFLQQRYTDDKACNNTQLNAISVANKTILFNIDCTLLNVIIHEHCAALMAR